MTNEDIETIAMDISTSLAGRGSDGNPNLILYNYVRAVLERYQKSGSSQNPETIQITKSQIDTVVRAIFQLLGNH